VAFVDQYDPGVKLFTSRDGGDTWSLRVTMHGGLSYGQANPGDLPIGPVRLRCDQPQVRQHGGGLPRLRSLVPPLPDGE
jgi:hypothetical protein